MAIEIKEYDGFKPKRPTSIKQSTDNKSNGNKKEIKNTNK